MSGVDKKVRKRPLRLQIKILLAFGQQSDNIRRKIIRQPANLIMILKNLALEEKVVAIGQCGLDYYHNQASKKLKLKIIKKYKKKFY